jgi:hypothetical protein
MFLRIVRGLTLDHTVTSQKSSISCSYRCEILRSGLPRHAFLIHFQPAFLFFFCGSTAQFWALAASMKLSVSLQLLHLGQSEGLLGRVIISSQGLC